MSYKLWTKATDLQRWAAELEARQKLPALVRRLIHATVENPTLSQFPADEGIQRKGWDGLLCVAAGNAWVPAGESVWEMGADQVPATKAKEDYSKRTENPGNVKTENTTFVFVTPRKWEGKHKWRDEKRTENRWRDVIVLDCDDIEQWLETAPPVDAWLARLLGKHPLGLRDLSSYWTALTATTEPPLTTAMFLAGREKASENLQCALAGTPNEIPVSAISLNELRDFVSAVISNGDEELTEATAARAVIVESEDAWHQLTSNKFRLTLMVGDQLNLEKAMIAEAIASGHHVITQVEYTYLRGGTGIRLPQVDRWELQKALEKANFGDERSERLAREAGGCTSILIRLASKLSGHRSPKWARPDEAACLLPLVLLGAWEDRNQEDRKCVERISKLEYGQVQQIACPTRTSGYRRRSPRARG